MKLLLLMLTVGLIMVIVNVVIYCMGIPQWTAIFFSIPVACIGFLDVWQD